MPGTGGQAGGSNPHLIWAARWSSPPPTPVLRSPTVCHSWHFQGSDTCVRGPSLTPWLSASHQLCFPDLIITEPKLYIHPPVCPDAWTPGWGAGSPAASWITFLKPQPFPETTCSQLNLNPQGEGEREEGRFSLPLLSSEKSLHPLPPPPLLFPSITSSLHLLEEKQFSGAT